MTDDEIKQIEREYEAWASRCACECGRVANHFPKLLAEVKKMRNYLKFVKEWNDYNEFKDRM